MILGAEEETTPVPEEDIEVVEVEVRLPNGQTHTISCPPSLTLLQLKSDFLNVLKYVHHPPVLCKEGLSPHT